MYTIKTTANVRLANGKILYNTILTNVIHPNCTYHRIQFWFLFQLEKKKKETINIRSTHRHEKEWWSEKCRHTNCLCCRMESTLLKRKRVSHVDGSTIKLWKYVHFENAIGTNGCIAIVQFVLENWWKTIMKWHGMSFGIFFLFDPPSKNRFQF